MRFILRLKHWQLFLMIFGLPIFKGIFENTAPGQEGPIDILFGSVTVFGMFSWIWSITNILYKKIPDAEKSKLWTFRILFFVALTILTWVFWTTEKNTIPDIELTITLTSIPIYLGLMIFVVLFAARTFRTVELGRPVHSREYLVEAFFIWMSPLGLWFIQPRLNDLTDKDSKQE